MYSLLHHKESLCLDTSATQLLWMVTKDMGSDAGCNYIAQGADYEGAVSIPCPAESIFGIGSNIFIALTDCMSVHKEMGIHI